MYQGWGNTRKYFEGWYFKVVNASETRAFAFIPGISMNESGKNRHLYRSSTAGKKPLSFTRLRHRNSSPQKRTLR